MSIGQNIHKKRKELNMTLEDVAIKVGISRQTLSRYETGIINNIPLDKIEAIANTLNTTPAYLMGWEDNTNETSPVEQENEKIRILNRGISKLTPEEQDKLLSFAKIMFEEAFNDE